MGGSSRPRSSKIDGLAPPAQTAPPWRFHVRISSGPPVEDDVEDCVAPCRRSDRRARGVFALADAGDRATAGAGTPDDHRLDGRGAAHVGAARRRLAAIGRAAAAHTPRRPARRRADARALRPISSRCAGIRRGRGGTVERRAGRVGVRQRLRGHRRRDLAGHRSGPGAGDHRGARRRRDRARAGTRHPAAGRRLPADVARARRGRRRHP